METTLDKFGRVVIPKRVRDDLGLAPGAVLEIEEDDGRVVLRPRQGSPDLVEEDGVLVYTGEAVGDLREVIRVVRDERTGRLTGRRGQPER